MLKKFVFLVGLLFFVDFTFAVSFSHFDVKLDKPYQQGNIFTVQPKSIDGKMVNMHFFINNEEFPRLSTNENNNYQFKIPSDLKLGDKNLKIEVDFADKTKKDYVYKLPIPYFIGIDATNLTGGGTFNIYGTLTGSCSLHLGDLSLGISTKDGKHFFTMPDNVKNIIISSYVVCNDIVSNAKPIKILPSPELYYAVSEDKKNLIPGDDLVVEGNYIKLNSNDDIKVLLNGKELNYTFLTNNKIKVELPYANLSSATLQVIRNGFKSNTLKLNIIKYPKIYQVGIINKGSNYFFRLYGDFDFKLGGLSVNYAGKTLEVFSTGSINSLSYIDIALPKGNIDTDGNISCNYYLYPSYFYVNLGTKKSNGFFYEAEDLTKINEIKSLSCTNGSCNLEAFLNKNPLKINVLLNGNKIRPSIIGNKLSLDLKDKFTKKGKIELLNKFCIKTQPYYFDFSDQFKPFIRYIESRNNFIPSGYFKIHGEKLTSDGYHTGMNLNINFDPDVIDKKTLIYDGNTIEGEILSSAKKSQKVNISLSNLNSSTNGAYFIVGGNNKYMANPYIKSVSYPDGDGVGDTIEINGINFDEYNCSKDIIYIGSKVIYPDSCDYNKLVFTVPDEVKGNTVEVEVNGIKSNTYTLNSTIGGDKIFKKFDIISVLSTKKVDLSKSSKVSLDLNVQNPLTDIYLSKLTFKLDFAKDYLPAGNFVLSVNGNDKKYFFDPENYKITQTDLINNGKIIKKGNSYFIEFDNIFIPYSSVEIPLNLSFEVFNSTDDNSSFDITLPKQIVYYENIYKSDKLANFDLLDKKITTIYVGNKQSICFDSDSTFKNCALVLKGKSIKMSEQTSTEDQNNQNQDTSTTQITNQNSQSQSNSTQTQNKIESNSTNQSKPVISKREIIAKKLTTKNMEILNESIKKYLIKLKKKYWGTKKIYYVVDMYKGYKIMESNLSDDFDKKLNYVDGLIYFAKSYFLYQKSK